MADRIDESKNQPLADPRANLFYLLQQLSRTTEVKNCNRGSEFPVSDGQTVANERRLTPSRHRSIQTEVLTSGWSRDAL